MSRVRGWARDTEGLAPIVQEADPGFFEHRAMLAFRILAGIYLAGIVLEFFHEPNTISLLEILAFNGAAFILALLYILIARGLRVLQPWAIAVSRPIFLLVIIEDIAVTVLTVAEGRFRLPIASVIAVWALRGPGGNRPVAWPKLFSGVVLLLATPMLATLVFSEQVFGWGGALDVHEPDLTETAVASCEPAGSGTTPGLPPERVHVTVDWAWNKSVVLPSGLDIVVVGWTGDDAEGRPLYLLGPVPPTQPGIYDGRRTYPSLEMGNAIAAASRGSWQWGIELGQQALRPGHIEADLDRAHEAAPGSQPLQIQVSYVHLGLWHIDVPITCTW